jgi:hypothetical protein
MVKLVEEFVEYRFIEYREYTNYSDGELIKLLDYDKITDNIIEDILLNIDKTLPTKIGIEGFSFSSKNGDIIDLVTFSTLLRKKLYDKISKDILVMAPTTLKLESCKLTYKPINIGKKKEIFEWRNNDGVAGGSFKKNQMCLALIENETFNDEYIKILRMNREILETIKNIPKPMEDLNDALLLFKYLEKSIK